MITSRGEVRMTVRTTAATTTTGSDTHTTLLGETLLQTVRVRMTRSRVERHGLVNEFLSPRSSDTPGDSDEDQDKPKDTNDSENST